MIRLENVTYRYPRTSKPVLNDLNLEIPAGQFCAVLGANGAGKSTLCYVLSGFIPHFYRGTLQGEISVAGHNVRETPLAELAGTVGFVFANPFNQITGTKYTVREEIAFGLENMGVPRDEMIERIERVLALTGLEELAKRSPYELSGGQQQRLAIASVLVMQPDVLILDEPTAQLDPDGARDVFQILRTLADSKESIIVLAGHRVELVALHADRAVVLQNGHIVADGAPGEILVTPELASYGIHGTRYTEVARLARERGVVPAEGVLPVTLEEAVRFFT